MSLRQRIASLLFPPKCMFCRTIIDSGYICDDCRYEIPVFGQVSKGGEFFSKSTSALYYSGKVRRAILAYKFHGKRSYAIGFAELLADTVMTNLSGEYDIITWAPVSARRLWRRGYDQARLLAEKTAEILGTTAVPTLKKVRHTRANSSLSDHSKRAANVSGVYRVISRETVAGKRVLLIDDVITTGSTLSECGRMLLTAGAKDVICATAATARKR